MFVVQCALCPVAHKQVLCSIENVIFSSIFFSLFYYWVVFLDMTQVFLTSQSKAHLSIIRVGHHNDLTRNTLQLMGYNQYAQEIAGIANFFVDYYAFTPELYGLFS